MRPPFPAPRDPLKRLPIRSHRYASFSIPPWSASEASISLEALSRYCSVRVPGVLGHEARAHEEHDGSLHVVNVHPAHRFIHGHRSYPSIEKPEAMFLHHRARLVRGFRQNVKESAHALAAKDYAAAVLVGLDGVIHARFGEEPIPAATPPAVFWRCRPDPYHDLQRNRLRGA